MVRKRLTPLFIVGLTLSCLGISGCSNSELGGTTQVASIALRQVEVLAESVQYQVLASQFEFTGNLLPRRASRLTFEVDGIVAEIPQAGASFDVTYKGRQYQERLGLIFGQSVEQGDELVKLNTDDFQLQVQIEQAKLAKARADLAKLLSGQRSEEIQRLTARNESKARCDQATRENQRLQELRRQNVVSASEYEQTAMQAAAAEAMLASVEATLASALAGPTSEEVAVQQALVNQAEVELMQSQQKLAKAVLTAPYSGVVVSINVEVGDRVAASSSPIIEMMDISFLVAEIGVPETYVGKVRVGERAEVRAAGSTESQPGLIVAINEMVDPQTRTFKVRVAIDNAKRLFKAGQFAKVTLPIGASSNQSLTIPSQSIVFSDGQPTVFIVEDDRVRQVNIKLGVASQTDTEVLSGVRDGNLVVIDDPTLLADGMQVKVRESEVKKVASRN